MATNTRPELSSKNKWWISRHRYYELRHFCLQYPEWKERLKELDGLPPMSATAKERINPGQTGDPTVYYVEAREFLSHRITLVEKAAYEACEHQFWCMILIDAVTTNASYDVLQAKKGIMPVSRDVWYEVYRKFFWFLDKIRD